MNKAFFWLALIVLAELTVAPAKPSAKSSRRQKTIFELTARPAMVRRAKAMAMAGASLPVKPADHTNGAAMNQLSDKFLIDIISKGGSGVGKSTFMPSWGAALNDRQVRDVVAYIRSIAVPPYKP